MSRNGVMVYDFDLPPGLCALKFANRKLNHFSKENPLSKILLKLGRMLSLRRRKEGPPSTPLKKWTISPFDILLNSNQLHIISPKICNVVCTGGRPTEC